MGVTDTFGTWVTEQTGKDPEKGRKLLDFGWGLQNLKLHAAPDRRLTSADQYLAEVMMRAMRAPLKTPEQSAIVSIFLPCEMLHELGLHPYNAEAFSCYLEASRAGHACLEEANSEGLSETLCSYHRTFIGAAERGLMPKPKCIAYTNLTCDANLVTFQYLSDLYHVPTFFVDVPLRVDDASVQYVKQQLLELKKFLETTCGTAIDDAPLAGRLAKSRQSLLNYDRYQHLRADRAIGNDLVTPLYCGMANNILLGTDEELRYTEKLLQCVEKAPPSTGTRIYWMHTIPFRSDAVKALLSFQENAHIVGDELQQLCRPDFDPDDPYAAMAYRMVHNSYNGPVERRIENGIRNAKAAGADGVVWFDHWGCKHTIGAANLAKKQFEAAGLPCLILDGDGCDPANSGEGQMSTRLGAFMEMLETSPDAAGTYTEEPNE